MSPDNSLIPPSAQIVDDFGQVWTLSGIDVLRNGVLAGGGHGSKILWVNGHIFVFGTDNEWYLWNGTDWTQVGPLQPSPADEDLQVLIVMYDDLPNIITQYGTRIKFAGLSCSATPDCPANSFVIIVSQ